MPRVLHIEDDPRNRLLVRKLLTAEGLEVIDAPDGLTGVRLALSHRPDLVLVDLNIPGLDGYEVTLRLRSEPTLATVPIVAITAEGDRDTSAAVGCDGFVQKPIDARVFGSQIRSYIRGHRPSFATSPDATGERLRLQSGRIVAHLEEKVAELSAANERLREVERLRAEFYRNISHELATPLTPIVGYLRMLLDEELGGVSKPQLKALRAMDDCVRRLRGTLDNLIDVTGLETGRMKFFHRDYDFLDTVRRAIAGTSDKFADRRIGIVEQLPRGPAPAFGDADRLGRAIGQLLDNAAKFTPEGGVVGVAVWRNDSGYAVTVADTGPGIPPEREQTIFEPFVQLDGSPTREHGGVGVGLAIARRVARGLGGDVQLQRGGAVIGGHELRGAAVTLSVAVRAAPPSVRPRA
jgi:signal transduction histidine kinase